MIQQSNYKVYWTENAQAHSQDFSDDITAALGKMAELRATPTASYICMSSQIQGCVSLDGVGECPADYTWAKRRPMTAEELAKDLAKS